MSENCGLYIHIPFCVKKCPYCDFYSVSDLCLRSEFLKALSIEMQLKSDLKNKIDTIYFGGGTPSLIPPSDIEKILVLIHKLFNITSNPEITMEVNPGTVNKEYFFNIKALGVNRVNIGVQSFQDKKLKFLERIHSAGQAAKTIQWAEKAGFDNLGIDLIYGLPGEKRQNWIADINSGLGFMPSHLSCYMLTYEPGTRMYDRLEKGIIMPIDDDSAASLFITVSQLLEKNNYIHYEISNFARGMTKRSAHNEKYWKAVPYLGFGPSAHSFDTKIRSWNYRDVKKYIGLLQKNSLPVENQEKLTLEQKITEMVMLGLRTSRGVNFKKFKDLAGKDFVPFFKSIIQRLESESMGVTNKKNFHLTLNGMLVLDSITALFADKILYHGITEEKL